MIEAPDRIWVDKEGVSDKGRWVWGSWYDAPSEPGMREYHLVRDGQPCSDREFMRRLAAADWWPDDMQEAIGQWLAGDFAAAMEGLGND